VAILAGGGNFSGGGDLSVNAVRVALAFIGVTLVASDFFWRRVVRQAFDVCMAIDARKCAVNGVLELVLVDGDAVAVAIGHSGVGVAGEAVGVLEPLRGGWGGPGKKEERGETNEGPVDDFHSLRRRFGEKACRDTSHKGSY